MRDDHVLIGTTPTDEPHDEALKRVVEKVHPLFIGATNILVS